VDTKVPRFTERRDVWLPPNDRCSKHCAGAAVTDVVPGKRLTSNPSLPHCAGAADLDNEVSVAGFDNLRVRGPLNH